MPHVKFEPMKELEFLSEKLKKFAEDFPESFSFEIGNGFDPKTDVLHDDSSVYVYIELPGVKREQVKVSLKDDILTVSGTKDPAFDPEGPTRSRSECAYGEFKREITLPAQVDASTIKASLVDGLLAITLTKQEPDAEKEISIEIE